MYGQSHMRMLGCGGRGGGREGGYKMNRSLDVLDERGTTLVIRRFVPVMPSQELALHAPESVSIADDAATVPVHLAFLPDLRILDRYI